MPMMGRRWPKLPEVGAANLRPRPLRKKACVRPPPCPARAAWAVLSPSSPYPTEDWLFPFDRSLPALVFLRGSGPSGNRSPADAPCRAHLIKIKGASFSAVTQSFQLRIGGKLYDETGGAERCFRRPHPLCLSCARVCAVWRRHE